MTNNLYRQNGLTPEIVGGIAGQDMIFGNADVEPELSGLEVRFEIEGGVALEVGDVEPGRVEAVDFGEEVPRGRDGPGFEVVAKRPVAEHFKECMMVRIPTDVVEIVVLPACADALLRIGQA